MTQPAPYLLGTSEAELARLRRQNEALAAETAWLFERLAIRLGARAIDVGCGPVGVLEILARLVGPRGSVVGLDVSDIMLQQARQALAARGLTDVVLVRADAAASGLPRASFDVVHERLVLVNVPEPEAVVREMVALARPGGLVALTEIDSISWSCDPPHPAWERLQGAFTTVFTGRGCDPHIGRRLPRLLREAGLVDVQHEFHARQHGLDHVWRYLLLQFSDVARDQALALGLLSARDFDDLRMELAAHLADPATTVLSPIVAHAWGRKA